jgi:hypothetical protein
MHLLDAANAEVCFAGVGEAMLTDDHSGCLENRLEEKIELSSFKSRQGEMFVSHKELLSPKFWNYLGRVLIWISCACIYLRILPSYLSIASFNEVQIWFPTYAELILLIVSLLMVYTALRCHVRARRLEVVTFKKLPSEYSERPILYLRSFKDDEITAKPIQSALFLLLRFRPLLFTILDTATEEEQLARALRFIGPVVAIGGPEEDKPGLGAVRLYAPNDKWQDTVISLMQSARLIVLRAGDTDGFWWELKSSSMYVNPERLLLLIPFGKGEYEVFRQIAEYYLPKPLPSYNGLKTTYGTLRGIIYFQSDWTPIFVKFDTRYARGHRRAPLVPMLQAALQPIFQRFQITWCKPVIKWKIFKRIPPIYHGTALLGTIWLILIIYLTGGRYFFETKFEKFARRLETYSEIRDKFAGLSEEKARELSQSMAKTAMLRLSDASLVERARLIAKILRATSPDVCASIARGTITETQLLAVIATLDSATQESYFNLITEALLAEIRGSPSLRKPNKYETNESLIVLYAIIPSNQREELAQYRLNPKQANNEYACGCARLLYEKLLVLGEPFRSNLARALLSE